MLERLECYFYKLAAAYYKICSQQGREFFGLRDFYRLACIAIYKLLCSELLTFHCSLIKMLYWLMMKSETELTKAQLEHAIKRNFSGYDEFNPFDMFVEQDFQEFKVK